MFTILKSPHIHKSAQKNFGIYKYIKQVIIVLVNILKFIILLRIFVYKLFFDVKIKIIYYFCYINFIIKKFKFKNLYFFSYSNLYKKKIIFNVRIKIINKFLNIITKYVVES